MGRKKIVVRYNPDTCGLIDLIEMVSKALTDNRLGYEAQNIRRRIRSEAQSIEKAVAILGEYVILKKIKKTPPIKGGYTVVRRRADRMK